MSSDAKPEEGKKPAPLTEETPVTRSHKLGKLEYDTIVGRMPLKDADGEIEAQIFFTAYIKKSSKPAKDRPLMFSFNGGPGSPAIWLHLGALGPKRAEMTEDGNLPKPPYNLAENPHHWLNEVDLVFIDPVGTGFSRAKDQATAEKAWSVDGDIESVGEFIRLFLTRYNRWNSPLFLVGESYGTTRAAGLAGKLIEKGIAFNGIVLVSSILNFQTAEFRKGNDLPYPLFLPTYAATGHYHGKVQGELQEVIDKAREFALGRYWTALAKGSLLPDKERTAVKKELSKLTGLSESYLESCDLRPVIHQFVKELLRDQKRTVGRLDSRIKGIDDAQRHVDDRNEHDPSMSILMPPYVSLFHTYIREELGYETDLEYEIFRGIKKPWNWGSSRDGYPDTSDALRRAMHRNPYMKVFIASGYYDLATPFFATEYTVAHMGLDSSLAGNIQTEEYKAGHMMYIDTSCLEKLKKDVAGFVSGCL